MTTGLYLAPLVTFSFVLARVGGLVVTAPLLSFGALPWKLRLFLAIALALVVTPIELSAPPVIPPNLPVYTIRLAGELLIGALLGVGVMVLVAGAQLAGQIISQMSGLSVADAFNPAFDEEAPVLANLLQMTALAVFVAIGGHRLLVGALLDTYTAMPPGRAELLSSVGKLVPSLLAESFSLAVRGAAPAIVAVLLATISLGLISRTLPQMNIMAIGFGLNVLVTLGILALSIGGIAWLFQEQLEPAVETVLAALRPI
jgi:flagellar biosynthesis protein FliR